MKTRILIILDSSDPDRLTYEIDAIYDWVAVSDEANDDISIRATAMPEPIP